MRIRLFVCVLLALLAPRAFAQTIDCSVPSATPDDNEDDRVVIQSALDTKGCAELGPGVYDISDNPDPGLVGIPALTLRENRTLRGSGPSTVLKFSGVASGDWVGVRMSGTGPLLADVLLDSTALTNTQEQTHTVQVQGHPNATIGTTKAATVRGVWFVHPSRGMPGGDCLRLLGEETHQVSLIVEGNHFLTCDRSGIAIQRGVYGASISNNIFYKTGDQDIDVEMTGTGVGGDWTISGNIFLPGVLRSISVAFAGAPATRVVFSHNVMRSGGLNAYNLQHAVIADNVIEYSTPSTAPVISMIKASSDIVISNNVIVRTGAAGVGALLSFEHHNTGSPGRLSVIGNSFVQQTGGAIASFVSAQDVVVSGNRFHYDGEGTAARGVSFGGVTRPVERVVVIGNMFSGPLAIAVVLPTGIVSASIVGNMATHAVLGLRCGTVAPDGSIVSSGNTWTSGACPAATTGN